MEKEKASCPACGELGEAEYAFRKAGWPEQDSWLPAAAAGLVTVRTIHDSGSRKKLVQKCPSCGRYFYYELDYEFLVNGTEDEERLIRITEKEAGEMR